MANSADTKQKRSPIIVVMGHVDHGKTTLIDYIRKTNVAAKEAGGITQTIGAYEITHMPTGADPARTNADSQHKTASGSPESAYRMTFIDTPGHEAFTHMRSRGAAVADLAILVVAADEGVKPQTEEAIRILDETKTIFVVAITKIDKEGADLDRVKNELAGKGVLLEGYGGQISFQPLSGKTGEGVNELLDLLALAADLENLSYDPDAPCSGFILESKKDSRRGLEISVIVKNGILRKGMKISTPTANGKVKILENFLGKHINELVPSSPALIIGFEELPVVGEEFSTGDIVRAQTGGITRNITQTVAEDGLKATRLILKAADMGSLEALEGLVLRISEENPFFVVDRTIGNIHDGDVKSAIASKTLILGFRTKVDGAAKNLAEAHKIQIFTSDVIYDFAKLLEDVIRKQKKITAGDLEILAVFNQTEMPKQIIGGKVAAGIFKNRSIFEVFRDNQSIGTGKTVNLQHNKKDLEEVGKDKEAGVLVNSDIPIKPHDHLIIFGE